MDKYVGKLCNLTSPFTLASWTCQRLRGLVCFAQSVGPGLNLFLYRRMAGSNQKVLRLILVLDQFKLRRFLSR